MTQNQPRIFLIFNPQGVVDRDIYFSSQNGHFQVKSCEIKVSQTTEGHTIEKLDLMDAAKRIVSFKPDFVLTVNGAGLDNDGFFACFCACMKIPLVIWYVDEPFVVPEWGQKFIPETTVAFTFDRFYEKRLKDWGIPWVYTLPLGANVQRMLGHALSAPGAAGRSDDVSFVGTLDYAKIEYLLKNILKLWASMPAGMEEVLGESIREYRLNPKMETEEIIRQCAERHGVEFAFPDGVVKQMVLSFIDREASFRLRHEVVEALKPFGISVYGEEFWAKLIGRESYKGPIDYYSDDIARLYKGSRINVNISKYQLKRTVNQRVFDCPLCDGFLITDFKEDIEEYFEIDKSIVVFYDLQDLKDKVSFYLENENKARKLVENAKETIMNRHTYQHRIEEMCSKLGRIKSETSFQARCSAVLSRSLPPKFKLFIEKLREEKLTH